MVYKSLKKRDGHPVLYAWGELIDDMLHVAYGALNMKVSDNTLTLIDRKGKRLRVILSVEHHTKGLPKSLRDVELEVQHGNEKE